MPEYKRKKVHTGKRRRANPSVQKTEINIPMSRSKKIKFSNNDDSKIRILPDKKGEKQKRFTVLLSVVAVVIISAVILSFTLPVGLIESTQTFLYSIGRGGFPADISGTSVLNCVQRDNYYYVLTDTGIMAFSNGGKKIFSAVHGFASPVIKTSQTRAIVFDQGKNTAIIYNLSGAVKTITSKEPIITANITKDGQYALVTKSDSYAGCVNVYDRRGKQLYNINFAKDMVNNVSISSSGDRIAVSTLNAESGKMSSYFKIYKFDSADSVFNLDLGEDTVYDISNTSKGFFVTTRNRIRFIHRSRFTVYEHLFEGQIGLTRYNSSGMLAVYNKTNDKSINTVVYISRSGKKVFEFDIKHAISDIKFSGGRVYALEDGKVAIYDKTGQILGSEECTFSCKKISVTGSNTVCVITDENIQKITVNKR